MRALVKIILSATLASAAGLTISALAQHRDPSLHWIHARMYGTCAFCVVLLACLIVMRVQARSVEH